MNLKIFIQLSMILTVIGLGLILGSCKKEVSQKEKAFVTFILGEAKITRPGQATNLLKVKQQVYNGDEIETGSKAHVTLQIRKDIVVVIAPDTKIVLNKIEDSQQKDFDLKQGETLSKLEKLSKGQGFMIRTPTLSAGVRGTQFLTSYNNNKSTVSVGSGAVSVTHLGNNASLLLEPGKSSDLSQGLAHIVVRNQNAQEALKLKMLSKMPVLENLENATDSQLDSISQEISKNLQDFIQKMDNLLKMSDAEVFPTLNELKSKHGRIDVVRLYSGKEIQGIIAQRGDVVKIITPTGLLEINSKEIESTDILK